jgi:hypothetical protein
LIFGDARQELWRHLIGQPYAVVGQEELETLCVHVKGLDLEDDRLAMTLTNALRSGFIDGQMYVLPILRPQPF